jgi:hypothetical protein
MTSTYEASMWLGLESDLIKYLEQMGQQMTHAHFIKRHKCYEEQNYKSTLVPTKKGVKPMLVKCINPGHIESC